jgi:hypothetical protein
MRPGKEADKEADKIKPRYLKQKPASRNLTYRLALWLAQWVSACSCPFVTSQSGCRCLGLRVTLSRRLCGHYQTGLPLVPQCSWQMHSYHTHQQQIHSYQTHPNKSAQTHNQSQQPSFGQDTAGTTTTQNQLPRGRGWSALTDSKPAV